MKNFSKTITAAIAIILFILPNSSFAQEQVKFDLTRQISLKNESAKSEVKVKISEAYNFLQLDILCQLRKGEINLEITDPNGNKKGEFSVKTNFGDSSTTTEIVNGSWMKSFKHPLNGDWVIKLTPKSATGEVHIVSRMKFIPQIDMIHVDEIVR